MKIITADFETFYSAAFSLTKLTTEQYIRDPQFETIGISIAINDEPPVWYPKPQVKAALAAIDWSDAFVLCQNTAFDGAILAWHYDVHPMGYLDTLGMSRALYPHEKSHSLDAQSKREGLGVKGDEVLKALGMRYADFTPDQLMRYGVYCCNDVTLTRRLFHTYMAKGFPKKELKLIDLTLRMFIEPVLQLDTGVLTSHLRDVKNHKRDLLDKVRAALLGDATDPEVTQVVFSDDPEALKSLLMSNDRFAKALQAVGVEPPTKTSPATGKTAWAFAKTDEAFKALEEHPDVAVQALVAARLGTKTTLEETRTERFIGMATRGTFPVPLRYYGAHSGRFSGQDSVNLQNLPARGPNAGKIKKSIKAPAGHVVIDCDSAQIEARTLAWLAGQEDLVQAFRDKQDVYKLMASKIFGITVEEVTPQQRQIGKTVVLGAGYGVGHAKLQGFLKMQAKVVVTLEESKRIIDTYRASVPRIVELWRKGQTSLEAMLRQQELQIDMPGICRAVVLNKITLPSGLHIRYPNLRTHQNEEGKVEYLYTSKDLPVRVYGGKVVENICQAVARCVVAEQMLRVAKRYKVVLTVHDSIAIVAPKDEAKEAQAYLEECMSWNPAWATGLPLACESGVGESYGDC